jgi:hypothetical protein
MPTLNITFPAPSPAPSSGYRVKYWPTDNPANITTSIIATNSLSVPGLTGTSYTGTIEVICGEGAYSSPRNFTTVV